MHLFFSVLRLYLGMGAQPQMTRGEDPWSNGINGLVCLKVCATGQWHFGNILKEVFTVDLRISSCLKSWKTVLRLSVCAWFCWADYLALHQYCRWVEEDACRDLGTILPCVLSTGMLPGGRGGRRSLGSAPRECVGFPIAALGDGSLLPPSAALNAQLLPCILPSFPPSAADSFGEQGATHTHHHSEKAVGEFVLRLFWTWSLPGEVLADCRAVKAAPLAHPPSPPPFPSSMAHPLPLCVFIQCIPQVLR